MCLQEIFSTYQAELQELRSEKNDIEKQMKLIKAEMQVCICILYVYVYKFVYCMYVRAHAHTHTHMHIHIQTHTQVLFDKTMDIT